MGAILFKIMFVCLIVGAVGSFFDDEYEARQEKKEQIVIDTMGVME